VNVGDRLQIDCPMASIKLRLFLRNSDMGHLIGQDHKLQSGSGVQLKRVRFG
jgi:predicted RNA-binding protein YlqC (UPF0109 family)